MSTFTSVRNPKITVNLVQRDQLVGLEDYRVLLIGQKLSAGSAPAGLGKDMPRGLDEIDLLFGARSHLAMIARRFRKVNPYTKVDYIALEDATGTNATAVLLVAGTATAARSIYVDVVSSQDHSYKIDVEVGDDEAAFTAKVLAKVALDTRCPFTAAKSTVAATDDTTTFTSTHDGTISNGWLIRIRDQFGRPASVPGLTFTLTGWTGGATDPTLTSIFDAAENTRYHAVVWPSSYTTTAPKAWINARFNLDNDIKDGVVYQWVNDTFSNVKTAANAMNSPSWVMLWNEPMNTAYWKGAHLPEAPDALAAEFAAIEARRFEEGISISDLVVNNETLDQFGGIHTASLPYFNSPFVYSGQPEEGAGATYPEQLELEGAGVSVIGRNVPNNAVIAGAMVTTYQNDSAGNPDDTWKWLNWRRTHAVMREFFVNNLREDLAQHRMTTGRAVPGYAMVDEARFRSLCGKYFDALAEEAITVAGRPARKYFDEHLQVWFRPDQRLIEFGADCPMVSQFGEARGTIKFNFFAA